MAKHTIKIEISDEDIVDVLGGALFDKLAVHRCIPELVRLVESAFKAEALWDELHYHANYLEYEIDRGAIPSPTDRR